MKILVADDSPVLRTAVSKLLTEAGYQTVTAEDGIEAIQCFYAERPDLVLLDIQMPRMSGYVACRVLKEDVAAAHIPVLILTVHDSAEDRYWGQKSGADGYLTKDALGEQLLSAIHAALAGRALAELNRTEADTRDMLEDDVLTRVSEVLDRKLFEASIINDITMLGTRPMDLKETMAQTLALLRRFVEYDVAAVLLSEERRLVARCDRPASAQDFALFRTLAVGHLQQLADIDASAEEVTPWRIDGEEITPDGPGAGWPSFLALPLRSRGMVLGVLALGVQRAGLFPDKVLRTLRLIEHPLATVLDSARHHQRLLEQEARQSLSSLLGGR